ncbi:MAG: hypothetical protein K2L59_00240 [Muribaculaceae bacterium]|nr:hypothetical protein [Muribaculaceae bacterium]
MKKQLLLMSAAALASGFAMAAPQTVTFSASPLTPPNTAAAENVRAYAAGENPYVVFSKALEPEAEWVEASLIKELLSPRPGSTSRRLALCFLNEREA